MLKRLIIIYLFLIISGCTWIEREYYYASHGNQSDWNQEFFEGEGGGKWIQIPAKDVLTYSYEDLQLKLHSSYLNMTFFGPVIVPIIPLPGDSLKNFSISIEVISKKGSIVINPEEWNLKILSPSVKAVATLKPSAVYNYLHDDEYKRKKHMFYTLVFPIEVADVEEIELEVEPIKYGNKVLKPSKLKLKKTKGDWYFNGFTV